MSLTLLKRPLGHKLNSTDVTAVIIDDGTGDALVYTSVAHGLSDGDYVYIESNLDSYNGFKYVDSIAYDSFKIKNSENGDFVEYVQDADISYRTSVLNHGWQAVHNLIVYELQSDIWPNNIAEESYTPVTVVSQENSNGYTLLNLSVGVEDATVLNFIELVGDSDLAGPYQIIQANNPWAIAINLAYDAANDFSGLQVVNYYNNYAVNVEVWAGLDSSHRWAAKKPYELAATLKFIPDSDGKIKFSIAEILKGYITTRNNLTLDTLPNNLDFHVSFYIKYYESYDNSDGETIVTQEGFVSTDTFEGHAVNAMMPFKSLNSGNMSDYVHEGAFLARWLTLFDRPLIIVDRFFDLSFINSLPNRDLLIHINGEVTRITNPGLGVIRVPVLPDAAGEVCITAFSDESTQMVPPVPENLSTFVNGGSGGDWSLGAQPEFIGTDGTKLLNEPYAIGGAVSLKINYTFQASEGMTQLILALTSTDFTLGPDTEIISTPSAGVYSGSVTILTTAARSYFAIYAFGGGLYTVTIQSISFGDPTEEVIPGEQITEQICCDALDECDSTLIDDELRITEGTEPRIIE